MTDLIRVDLSGYSIRQALGKPALHPPIHTLEYGGLNARFLSGEVTVFAEYRTTQKPAGHMPTNFLETGDMFHGVSYTFPFPLREGGVYRVEVGFDQKELTSPDRVAVQDEVYYERRPDAADKQLTFHYRASRNGTATFHFLQSHEIRDRVIPGYSVLSREKLRLGLNVSIAVTPISDGSARPTPLLGRFALPPDTRSWQSPNVYGEANHFTPVRWKARPLPEVPWPVEDVPIALHTESIAPSDKNLELQRKLLRFALDNHFTWANGVSLDLQDPETSALLERFPYLTGWYHISHDKVEDSIQRINDLLTRFPKAKVLVWFSEPDTTQQWHIANTEEGKAMLRPGINLRALRDLMADCYRRQITDRFKREVVDRKRMIILWQLAGMNGQGSDWFRFGIDLLQTKTIHRQCMNIVAASCRGAAAPLGKPYAMEYDSWNGVYYHQNGDTEVEFYFASLYFAGVRSLCNELATVGVCGDEVHPTAGGVKLIEFTRYMRRHPVRGSQLARVAFMRGADEFWFRPTGLGGNNHPLAVPGDHEVNYERTNPDWGLLDLVFPKFGTAHQANFRRTGTGTPYGPADLISWDLPASAMARYDVVVLVGRNTIDADALRQYVDYVRNGGVMVLAANSLRATDGVHSGYLKNADRLIGVKLGKDVHLAPSRFDEILPHQPLFYNRVRLPASADVRVLKRLENGDPYLIERRLGKGRVYFLATEYLTAVDEDTVRTLLAPLFAKAAPVRFPEGADWIETAIMAKRDSIALALINHGQARYPSDKGDDTGPWTGTVTVCLPKVSLPAPAEVFQLDRELHPRRVPSRMVKGELQFRITVDRWCELVIGRRGKALDDFFYGEPREPMRPLIGGLDD